MRWEHRARIQGGVVAREQLLAAGLTERAIDGLVARRELVGVLPSVYRSAASPDTTLGAFWSAVLWSGGVLSHGSAAHVWELPAPVPPRTQVSVSDLGDRGRATRSSVYVHRVQLSEAECTTRDGLPITTRLRTIVDLLGVLSLPRGRELLGHSLNKRWITLGDLDRRLVDGRGRAGNVRIRKLRQEADPKAQAEFERAVHRLLRARGITGWKAQHPVELPSGVIIHADLAFPEQRIIVELDGWAYHNTGERFRNDRRRWRGAVARGWRVVQFTWDDLDHPEAFLREILLLLAA